MKRASLHKGVAIVWLQTRGKSEVSEAEPSLFIADDKGFARGWIGFG